MTQQCDKCKRVYDPEFYETRCPHAPLADSKIDIPYAMESAPPQWYIDLVVRPFVRQFYRELARRPHSI